MKLSAKELRVVDEEKATEGARNLKRKPIYFILENVLDTYNVGGLFRLADALAIERIYLVGDTETPPNTRIKKASIGTYKVVPWRYKKTAQEAVEELKKEVTDIRVYAVEQAENSTPYNEVEYSFPLALMVGNETSGITQEGLKLSDEIVEIPMWGINKSLNVIVSAAIVAYKVAERL